MNRTTINAAVSTEVVNDIALICIDNPPVNAAGHVVREGLVTAIRTLEGDANVQAIALYCAGRTFIAGADIREFGKPPIDPWLPDVCNVLENCAKPLVAVLHGTALGGGLEVALGCHARIGAPDLRIGLPEVLLGILPGAGGTQRTPRLAGIAFALDMITTGRHVPAHEALENGLIDEIRNGEPRDMALQAGADLRDGVLKARVTGALTVNADEPALEAARDRIRRKQPHLFSPLKCVDAVAASVLEISEGLKIERRLFHECHESPQRAGLVHAFFAERAVAKVPESSAQPRPLDRIGVIGGGTMGSGIATALLLAGYTVTLCEVSSEALHRGQSTIDSDLDGAVRRGKLDSDGHAAAMTRLSSSTDLQALEHCSLVIEAVFEDMQVKKDIFSRLDRILPQGAILATNTSYLDINEIAQATFRPADVLGLHFFSPAHVMRLMEIVVADATAPEVVSTGFALAKKLRKVAVRSGVCDGFIGNRIMMHYRKAADYLMLDGAGFEQVDTALEAFGFAMGPFRVADLAGLDIGWAARKRQAPTRSADERYVRISDRLCEAGWFGRKTGRGYYIYGDGSGPNPDAVKIMQDERVASGAPQREFSDQQIVDRYMTAMVIEATRVVEDGTALRPIDVDAVLLFGYGFPRHQGGPLHYADTVGAATLVSRINRWAVEDGYFWRVPPLLQQLADEGGTFASMNT